MKSFKWLNESNRPKHVKAGTLVFIVMLAVCLMLGVVLISSAVISFIATAIVAVSVEYKDKLWGGTFDWLDVAATVLLPGLITVLLIIVGSFYK